MKRFLDQDFFGESLEEFRSEVQVTPLSFSCYARDLLISSHAKPE